MELTLRDVRRVKPHSLIYILKNWKTSFSSLEKWIISLLVAVIVLTSWRWVAAARQDKELAPASGGVFIEGITGSPLDEIELGRLTKAGLVKSDNEERIIADLSSSWEIGEDKLSYKFKLVDTVSVYEIVDVLENNPIYLSKAQAKVVDDNTIGFELKEENSNFLQELSKPLFSYGPYRVDKKTKDEIQLIINPEYHLAPPYIEKFVIRFYQSQEALKQAAAKGAISGAINLEEVPENWQEGKMILNKKHILFINSSKTYLKQTKVRGKILSGERPDSIKTLDLLEVNGGGWDPEYEEFKKKLTEAGIDLKVRKISMKEAVIKDLPERNYDLLYLLVNEGEARDPYALWNSTQRSGVGQNFAELANADIDELTEAFRGTDNEEKKAKLFERITKLVDEERIIV